MTESINTALLLRKIKEKVLREGDDQGKRDGARYNEEFDVIKKRLERKKPDDNSFEHDIRLGNTLYPGEVVAVMQVDAFLAIQAVNPDLAQHTLDTHKKKAEGLAANELAAEESPAKQLATSVVKIEKNLKDSDWNPDHKKRY